MKNSSSQISEKFQKCHYQSIVYGADKCDLIHRKSYKGDWGHWDELPKDDEKFVYDSDLNDNAADHHQKAKL